jgi:hypothetical protein
VTLVEDGAYSLFAFVGADDFRLDLARTADGVNHRAVDPGRQCVGIRFQPLEESRVVDQPILHDLGDAGAVLAFGQCR